MNQTTKIKLKTMARAVASANSTELMGHVAFMLGKELLKNLTAHEQFRLYHAESALTGDRVEYRKALKAVWAIDCALKRNHTARNWYKALLLSLKADADALNGAIGGFMAYGYAKENPMNKGLY